MLNAALVLAFAEITFPVLLLVPPLAVAFQFLEIAYAQLMRYFAVVISYYTILAVVAVVSATDWLTRGILIALSVLSGAGLFYVITWTANELLDIRIAPRRRRRAVR